MLDYVHLVDDVDQALRLGDAPEDLAYTQARLPAPALTWASAAKAETAIHAEPITAQPSAVRTPITGFFAAPSA